MLSALAIAIYGLSAVYGEMDNNKANEKHYAEAQKFTLIMLWIRVAPIALFCCCGTCVICCFVVIYGSAIAQEGNQTAARVNRLPIVNSVIRKKSRAYDSEKDAVVDTCSICLEKFEENDGKMIAELNCSSKHIYHVECLKEWVKKNDICPMCREPIV